MPPTLVHLPQSPWSEKARWALDHHGVTYRTVVHMPMVYEPLLRLASRELRKKPTVPMLFAGSVVLRDSLEIALFAEHHGKGSPLFPKTDETAIFTWNDHADRLLGAARARVMERLLTNRDALIEAIPPPLSKLGATLLPVAKLAAGFVANKYRTKATPPAQTEATIASVLELADARLSDHEHLVGDGFTFADIAFACALGMISPHARQPLGPASREVWSEPTIAAAFPRLVRWRDSLVERYR